MIQHDSKAFSKEPKWLLLIVSKASSFESIFQNAEVVAMLVNFPKHGHMLRFDKTQPLYGFLVKKYKKQVKSKN